jgi:ribosomal protein S18 acetylase RimI-like enzyme
VDINIRSATVTDYHALCRLFEEVDALHRDHLPQLFQKPPGPVREQSYYQAELTDENVGLFVAELNGGLVGFVHALIRDTTLIPVMVPRQYAIIDGIAVKSELRGCGIGSSLMHCIQEWAITKGATAIELNVYEFNIEAIHFYQRLGFDNLSRRMSKPLDEAGTTG